MSTSKASPLLAAPTGALLGDGSRTDNFSYQSGDIAWMLTAIVLIVLMIPGVGLFYAGLVRKKSALSLLWLSGMATAVASLQWLLWGYSLTFSPTAGRYIGDLHNFGFRYVLGQPSVAAGTMAELLFALYHGTVAAITVVIAVGAVAERGRTLPAMLFIFVWLNVIYAFIAFWTWHPNGWYARMGGLDFAGGTPVHISSGCAALAYSYVLGKRLGYGTKDLDQPHNATYIVLGTALLWVGWLGANAGSAHAANLRAVMAMVVTHFAACTGGIAWCLLDYRRERKWSAVGFCCGVLSGLVTISPGAGYVSPWAAVIFGVVGGITCNLATMLKIALRCDEPLDIFAVHAVGGLVGNLLTAFFAMDSIAHLDGVTHIAGGWVEHHWIQFAYQLAGSAAGAAYSFFGSYLILLVIGYLGRWWPALELRVTKEEEVLGLDEYNGQVAYMLDEPVEESDILTSSTPSSVETLICSSGNVANRSKSSQHTEAIVKCVERKATEA